MASPGVFLRPSSRSIPIKSAVRSRSPARSPARSIGSERPGTPRPGTNNQETSSGSHFFGDRPGVLLSQSASHSRSPRGAGPLLAAASASLESGNFCYLSQLQHLSPGLLTKPPVRSFSTSQPVLLAPSSAELRHPAPAKQRMLANSLDTDQLRKLEFYSKFTPTSVSLSHFMDHQASGGGVEQSFLFLRREIPVRLANIMMELELLPSELLAQPACQQIIHQYSNSFKEVLQFENQPTSQEIYLAFNNMLGNFLQRHQDTVSNMAEALHNMRDAGELTVSCKDRLNQAIQYFLDRLYMSRISIRMLISHHKALYCPEESKKVGERFIGTIDPACDAAKVAKEAFSNAAFLCDQMYMDAPKLDLAFTDLTNGNDNHEVNLVYIPSHLYQICFEVFKNSMRATMEFNDGSEIVPDVKVRIVKTNKDISIKISDLGGGISRKSSDNIFLYLYTSATRVKMPGGDMDGGAGGTTPMHGLGYGLPLSRLYARYLGGDIKVASMDGYGTDTYIYLKALESDAKENLPVFNASSSYKIQDTSNQVEDWTKDE